LQQVIAAKIRCLEKTGSFSGKTGRLNCFETSEKLANY
jgi:hypothetical protein